MLLTVILFYSLTSIFSVCCHFSLFSHSKLTQLFYLFSHYLIFLIRPYRARIEIWWWRWQVARERKYLNYSQGKGKHMSLIVIHIHRPTSCLTSAHDTPTHTQFTALPDDESPGASTAARRKLKCSEKFFILTFRRSLWIVRRHTVSHVWMVLCWFSTVVLIR